MIFKGKKKEKKRRYPAKYKPMSKENKLSVILSLASLAAFLFCMIMSAAMKGEAPSFIGGIGLASALLALYGCLLGIRELALAKIAYKKTYAGAIFGGVVFLIWLALFLTGIKHS